MKKTIVITGGSDGLGKTIAKNLIENNNVIILSPTREKLENVAKEIGTDFVVCDVRDVNSINQAINYILDKYLKIDVLINNAGIWIQEELDQNDSDKIREVIEVNLLGTINMAKAVIPNMKENKDGIIININSQASVSYKAKRTVYYASKWGVTGFTKSLQPELLKYGIRVTDVLPGKMITDMFKKSNIEKNMSNALDTKEVARVIKFIIETSKDVIIPEIGITSVNE